MKRIVILGAGFGGLRATILITKKITGLNLQNKYEVVLADRSEHHTYTPLLYEVATTSKQVANLVKLHNVATYNLKSIIKDLPIRLIQCEITSVDLIEGSIYINEKEKMSCDYMVLALGSETNYYNIPGLKEHSLTLKTFSSAIKIRDAVWNLATNTSGQINIIIGGGGSTGVELAGELENWCGQLEESFPKCRLSVKIIQAGPTVLRGFKPKIIQIAENRLRRLNVELITNEKITSAEKKKVILKSGRQVDFDIFIWTGGVKAPDMLAKLPLKTEARNRVEVIGGMECLPQTSDLRLHGKIYGLGDNICFYDPVTKKPLPGVARAAISQATIVAHNIIEDIKFENGLSKRADHKRYRPMEYPYIIPIGGKYAIAKIGPLVIKGFPGWLLKGLVELNYLLSIMPIGAALRIWLKGLKIFIQNDRLG